MEYIRFSPINLQPIFWMTGLCFLNNERAYCIWWFMTSSLFMAQYMRIQRSLDLYPGHSPSFMSNISQRSSSLYQNGSIKQCMDIDQIIVERETYDHVLQFEMLLSTCMLDSAPSVNSCIPLLW